MALSEERREERRRKQRKQKIIFYIVFYSICALIILGLFFGVRGLVRLIAGGGDTPPAAEVAAPLTAETVLSEAERLAAGYDYDAAIMHVQSFAGYETDESLTGAIARFEETKRTLQPANLHEITHVFYHTLIADNAKAFDGEYTEDGYISI